MRHHPLKLRIRDGDPAGTIVASCDAEHPRINLDAVLQRAASEFKQMRLHRDGSITGGRERIELISEDTVRLPTAAQVHALVTSAEVRACSLAWFDVRLQPHTASAFELTIAPRADLPTVSKRISLYVSLFPAHAELRETLAYVERAYLCGAIRLHVNLHGTAWPLISAADAMPDVDIAESSLDGVYHSTYDGRSYELQFDDDEDGGGGDAKEQSRVTDEDVDDAEGWFADTMAFFRFSSMLIGPEWKQSWTEFCRLSTDEEEDDDEEDDDEEDGDDALPFVSPKPAARQAELSPEPAPKSTVPKLADYASSAFLQRIVRRFRASSPLDAPPPSCVEFVAFLLRIGCMPSSDVGIVVKDVSSLDAESVRSGLAARHGTFVAICSIDDEKTFLVLKNRRGRMFVVDSGVAKEMTKTNVHSLLPSSSTYVSMHLFKQRDTASERVRPLECLKGAKEEEERTSLPQLSSLVSLSAVVPPPPMPAPRPLIGASPPLPKRADRSVVRMRLAGDASSSYIRCDVESILRVQSRAYETVLDRMRDHLRADSADEAIRVARDFLRSNPPLKMEEKKREAQR